MEEAAKFIKIAAKGISNYLNSQLKSKAISQELYDKATKNVINNIIKWINDKNIEDLSPNLKIGVYNAILQERWGDLVEAFIDDIKFGTAGIRGRAVLRAYDNPDLRDELQMLIINGLDAPVLKGPNTINNIVLLLKSAGIAKYANANGLTTIVVGHDSRILGTELAEMVSKLFLAYGLKVYFFDSAVPYPELMFSVVDLGASLGVYISASHNDKRYNGYKVCRYGAQINVLERNKMYTDYISKVITQDIKLKELDDASTNELIILGESTRHEGIDYYDSRFSRELIDMHTRYIEQCKKFIVDTQLLNVWAGAIDISYSAFHGTGGELLPRLLKELGFYKTSVTEHMNLPDGTFPSFKVDESPDPGDPEMMEIAVKKFVEEHNIEEFINCDIFIGTDPDSDRFGSVVKIKGDKDTNHVFLTADEAWSALLWYRLYKRAENGGGSIPDSNKQFIAFSHVTTDVLELLAKKYGLGYVKTWVGFPMMAGAIQKVWDGIPISRESCPDIVYDSYEMNSKRKINVFTCEQSNGFSIFGDKPKTMNTFGDMGHVKDKDGIFASAMFAELVAYAKSTNRSIIDILEQEIYTDGSIGAFVNYYETSPKSGQFEGIEGISKKINILKKAVEITDGLNHGNKKFVFGGLSAIRGEEYCTGKYDKSYDWPGFPDEGVRIFFSGDDYNYITIRPSGTSQSLRFYLQLRDKSVNKSDVKEKRKELYKKAVSVMRDIKQHVGAN